MAKTAPEHSVEGAPQSPLNNTSHIAALMDRVSKKMSSLEQHSAAMQQKNQHLETQLLTAQCKLTEATAERETAAAKATLALAACQQQQAAKVNSLQRLVDALREELQTEKRQKEEQECLHAAATVALEAANSQVQQTRAALSTAQLQNQVGAHAKQFCTFPGIGHMVV